MFKCFEELKQNLFADRATHTKRQRHIGAYLAGGRSGDNLLSERENFILTVLFYFCYFSTQNVFFQILLMPMSVWQWIITKQTAWGQNCCWKILFRFWRFYEANFGRKKTRVIVSEMLIPSWITTRGCSPEQFYYMQWVFVCMYVCRSCMIQWHWNVLIWCSL